MTAKTYADGTIGAIHADDIRFGDVLTELVPIESTFLQIAQDDAAGLAKARLSYGDSWKKRGGIGAFMMLARKWDRFELQCSKAGLLFDQYDVLGHIQRDTRSEGVIDDIRDLRRYLLLVLAERDRLDENGDEETINAHVLETATRIANIALLAKLKPLETRRNGELFFRLAIAWDELEENVRDNRYDVIGSAEDVHVGMLLRKLILNLTYVEAKARADGRLLGVHRDNA